MKLIWYVAVLRWQLIAAAAHMCSRSLSIDFNLFELSSDLYFLDVSACEMFRDARWLARTYRIVRRSWTMVARRDVTSNSFRHYQR